MANFGETRRSAFGRAQAAQHYAANLLGLNAADRHRKLVNDYLTYYARGAPGQPGGPPAEAAKSVRTDADALRDHHRFIRTEEDDGDHSWEARLAKRYYDRLFKEYAIVDLTFYKESRLGMRWRTQKEVVSGKGQFVCGAKGCDASDGLCSYEVNFAYQEAGERKQALVKLRVCPACAFKLNYRKEKQLQKAADAAAARKRKREREEAAELEAADPLVQEALQYVKRYAAGDKAPGEVDGGGGLSEEALLARAARDVAPPPGAAAGAAGAAGAGGGSGSAAGAAGGAAGQAPAIITLPADNSVWEAKPAQEAATAEEEMDAYFEGLFM
ncbi:hypothetical protein HYH02_012115 [Chlamydomonas schloesseri]|uniref:Protein FRA10AC1 n=1 Tax=Chlamydomonas schloesseri TaxID=2026947 RepID=A0A835SX42_9CHLO|nr:hypothetical protein HYH02_012115 [Chlamydomonas schloesseri]|eukprot:KAG2434917.1 hypothetical protein HYH02_012115 [Chlamydomonas schloesseri]